MNINLNVFSMGDNNGNTFELIGFDIVMIAMYIMAFKIAGKVVGEGSGGMVASKTIAVGAALALGAAGVAKGMGGGMSQGFKGLGDFKNQMSAARKAKFAMDPDKE
jgi:hypothetical protein